MTQETREQLVLAHMGRVDSLVNALCRGGRYGWMEREEMRAEGYRRIWELSARYDPARGEFWTWAEHRLRGVFCSAERQRLRRGELLRAQGTLSWIRQHEES
jgi:hypothetical protein